MSVSLSRSPSPDDTAGRPLRTRSALPDRAARTASAPVGVGTVLSGAVGHALGQLPEVAGASVMTHDRAGPVTLVHHGSAAETLDALQRRLKTGPTLEALRQGREFAVSDPVGEQRWRPLLERSGPMAAVSFILALPLLRQRRHGARAALTLYGTSPCVLGTLRGKARPFADHLSDIMRLGEHAEHARQTLEDMNRAVETRAVIDQAIGVLMVQQHCTPQAAFTILRRTSQSRNMKLRDVCQKLVSSVSGPPGRCAWPDEAGR